MVLPCLCLGVALLGCAAIDHADPSGFATAELVAGSWIAAITGGLIA